MGINVCVMFRFSYILMCDIYEVWSKIFLFNCFVIEGCVEDRFFLLWGRVEMFG